MRHHLLAAAGLSLAAALLPAGAFAQTAPAERKVETTSPDVWGAWGVDTSYLKPAVKPGDDFFMYVNGGWYDTFEIPADRTRYGAFNLLAEKSEQQVKFIIEDLAAEKPALTTPAGKVAAYYNAFLNTDAINAAGMKPAKPYLDRIAAISNKTQLAQAFGTPGFASPFGAFVNTDDKDPNTYIVNMFMGGLGLPDREYYTKTDEKSVELRTQYVALLSTLLTKAGYADADAAAARVMALETEIALADWDRALSRNPEITYNKVSWADLKKMSGGFPIDAMARAGGLKAVKEVLVIEIPPTAEELTAANLTAEDAAKLGGGYPELFKIVNKTDLDTWKAYLAAHFLIDRSAVLPSDIDAAVFAFYGTALSGQPEQRPRWKRAVTAVENALGEAIGATYVERHFPPQNKAAMDELVANLGKAMALNIADLKWMGDATKPMAVDKLDKFMPKIGYPNNFKTYASMKVTNDALANDMAAQKFAFEDNIADLGKKVDRTRWFMTPQTVNAYYNPSFNEIVFPAAILQPPFFNISADPAVNYGAIGGVIGHEMGHGFDDQGAKYDGDGVLRNWWSDADLEAFRALGAALTKQYNSFCPLGGEGDPCVNGDLTLGENIGDLGGLSLAYRAYKLSLNGQEAPVIDGLTGDQRFFLAWAQVWRAKIRDAALRNQLLTDPHSPAIYRVNGVVRNLNEWYEAFGVKPGDALYLPPEERVRIW